MQIYSVKEWLSVWGVHLWQNFCVSGRRYGWATWTSRPDRRSWRQGKLKAQQFYQSWRSEFRKAVTACGSAAPAQSSSHPAHSQTCLRSHLHHRGHHTDVWKTPASRNFCSFCKREVIMKLWNYYYIFCTQLKKLMKALNFSSWLHTNHLVLCLKNIKKM